MVCAALAGCYSGHEIREGKPVYVKTIGFGERLRTEVPGADTGSFRSIAGTPFAVDKTYAYFEIHQIRGALPDSFQSLSDHYAKDQKSVFWRDKLIQGADPRSFVLISNEWARDKTDIYLQETAIGACDRETFELLDFGWQRDSQCVYIRGKRILGADSSTFKPINHFCGRDKENAFDWITRKPVAPGTKC